MKIQMALMIVAGLLVCADLASAQSTSGSKAHPAAAPSNADQEPDVPVARPATSSPTTVKSQTDAAWNMLDSAQANTTPKGEQIRIDAVVALGTLGDFSRAVNWLSAVGKDPDRYVRLAAVTGMSTSKQTVFIPLLKRALEDAAPEVAFAAAVGLWKMNDRSGERILQSVAQGDRKASRGLVSAEKHEADQDLHSRSKLEKIGLEQGAYALLGPFGFGLSAIRSANGKNGIQPKVVAVTLLAEDRSPVAMKIFIDSQDDPDPLVRAAAARALGDYDDKEALDALSDSFYDIKPAVRLMAAASYIRAAHPEAEDKDAHHSKNASTRKR
ncbi:MAG TPA: HEAT repeat domain-containing protein [Acidobacteriaceae bacterium]|nr:HEAT repeat domain-containing protein [Acidobacteriaceae bacterium]